MLVMLMLSTIVGIIYFQLKDNFTGFQNRSRVQECMYMLCTISITYRVGVFYFITTNIVFGSISAIELFMQERPLFMYETVNAPLCI